MIVRGRLEKPTPVSADDRRFGAKTGQIRPDLHPNGDVEDQVPDLAKIVCMASSAALRAFWQAISWFMGTVEPS